MMRLNTPLDLLALKILGFGIKIYFESVSEGGRKQAQLWPDRALLCIEVTAAVFEWEKVWHLSRRG